MKEIKQINDETKYMIRVLVDAEIGLTTFFCIVKDDYFRAVSRYWNDYYYENYEKRQKAEEKKDD